MSLLAPASNTRSSQPQRALTPTPQTAACEPSSTHSAVTHSAVTHSAVPRPLPTPSGLKAQIGLSESGRRRIEVTRKTIRNLIHGRDSRLLVIVGPCSIHDPTSALEYAHRLQNAAERFSDELVIVMRTYFEKPRSSLGWKGLINDPHLDGSGDMLTGLMLARQLLQDVNALGLPAACELLDPNLSAYLTDLLSWAAIGARTSASQPHRELVSGLDLPVGFKNGVDGSFDAATDGIRAARHEQHRLCVDDSGQLVASTTPGNPDCHLVLRGGRSGPNFDRRSVGEASQVLAASESPTRVMIDVSHANSDKDPARQPEIVAEVARQVEQGGAILGVMIESHLVSGKQSLQHGKQLQYGQSITDGCVDFPTTLSMLEKLASAQKRRAGGELHSSSAGSDRRPPSA